jgi:hypothetical protein
MIIIKSGERFRCLMLTKGRKRASELSFLVGVRSYSYGVIFTFSNTFFSTYFYNIIAGGSLKWEKVNPYLELLQPFYGIYRNI